jgi:hypothetical protein
MLGVKRLPAQLLPDCGEQVRWRDPSLVQSEMPLDTDCESQN